MTSSFTFVALAKASAAQLQCKGILEKEIKTKLSLIIEISSKIQVTSSEHIRSEFSKSTNSAKLHSTCTWEKLVFWQKKVMLSSSHKQLYTTDSASSQFCHMQQLALRQPCCG